MTTRVIKGDEQNGRYINASGIADDVIESYMPGILKEVARWTDGDQWKTRRLSLFDRHAYVAPDSHYSLFQVAKRAVQNDDVVGAVCDAASGLTFQGVKWESSNSDDADIFNQIATDLDLDNFVRAWFKEDYTYSQAVICMWWDRKTYKVRGNSITLPQPDAVPDMSTGLASYSPKMDPKTGKPVKPKKTKRKKPYSVTCPVEISFLDPLKIVPLSPSFFGKDRLAWQSTPNEVAIYKSYRNGETLVPDQIMERLFIGDGPIQLPQGERDYLNLLGVDTYHLIELNPDYVFRIAPGRISYERWADIKLKRVMTLLDMKQQLIEADRVALIGQANYILLIRQGSKEEPAHDEELMALRAGMDNLAKVPIVVGDHRLTIDIITPSQDFTLDEGRYDTLDKRILHSCLGSILGAESRDPSISAKTVARVLEMKRHLLKRELEKRISKAICDHPANKDLFEEEPNISYTPQVVQINDDAQFLNNILALRTQKEISRGTTLELFGLDQDVEAARREEEDESGKDAVFQTQVPFSASGQSSQVSGIQGGGRPLGGGSSPASPGAQNKPRTSTGNPSTKGGK